jgi:hypothetical protein
MTQKKTWISAKMRAPNARWSQLAPTERQLAVLRRIERESNNTFRATMTRSDGAIPGAAMGWLL